MFFDFQWKLRTLDWLLAIVDVALWSLISPGPHLLDMLLLSKHHQVSVCCASCASQPVGLWFTHIFYCDFPIISFLEIRNAYFFFLQPRSFWTSTRTLFNFPNRGLTKKHFKTFYFLVLAFKLNITYFLFCHKYTDKHSLRELQFLFDN